MKLRNTNYIYGETSTSELLQTGFMGKVYGFFSLGLLITIITAGVFVTSPLGEVLRNMGFVMFGLIILQFIIVITLSAALNKLSVMSAVALFILYSFLTGITLSWVFFAYDIAGIMASFGAAVGMFAIMGIFGYFTKADLTKAGSIAILGLLGILLATFINAIMMIFNMYSETFDLLIAYAGVGIFLVLIAWDTQKLKNLAAHAQMNSEEEGKMAVLGGLSLYLDFLNLFLFLLRIFGRD
jgi:FtsH-binding integral membrane protein